MPLPPPESAAAGTAGAAGAPTLDELDHLLITALQTSPRAEWAQIGKALGVDASTAARRWHRLTEAGHAWLSCYTVAAGPTEPIIAFIEVDCATGGLHDVAVEIADDPHLITVEHVTGSRDLVLTAVFPDQSALGRYVGFRLDTLPGVAATRSQIATAVHAEGSRWRLDRLDPDGRDTLARDRPHSAPRIGLRSPDELDSRLSLLLSEDCRQSAARLAERTGVSATTVRRRLDRMHRTDALVYRCEVARCLSGWPVSVTMWGIAPPGEASRIAGQLIGMRETRLCASLSGPYNLLLTVWLRSAQDIAAFETRLGTRFPELTVADRAVTLWPLKLAGQILDPQGRHIRGVPVRFWEDPVTDRAEDDLVERLRGGRG
ncbi:Lrp/AsnC family transcriptional regulator [Streptomyces sp. BE147]|uniref:Lrp/AsnC family transcriptional regulator n=1 Tax=Streptomyces sp. BE147 TaxID=3002524 RepID=UPI002E7713A0|nr:Lrp/AsnC family transcriptional regulator [Streptomyces sp. BE147]MEE1739123.1 Lrp/AsnC family transcriptional regulator [Streptomyces sp. BE147]